MVEARIFLLQHFDKFVGIFNFLFTFTQRYLQIALKMINMNCRF